MNELLTQLGVGGIFAIIVIREVFNFINGRKNNGKAPCVTRLELNRLKESVQYKDNCEQIVKRIDASFQAQDKRFDKIDDDFKEVKSLIRNGGK